MGTRNLTCVVIDGEFKVAQYGQWDGYPTGQGETIHKIITAPDFDVARFTENVRACSWLTDEEREAAYKPYVTGDGWMTAEQAERFKASEWGYLSRDGGADILEVIYEKPRKVVDSRQFAADSLFCQWAYVVDLDAQTLEIYKGFNGAPVPDGERFAEFNSDPAPEHRKGAKDYYPVKLIKTIPLAELQSFDMAAFEEELRAAEEAAEEGAEA